MKNWNKEPNENVTDRTILWKSNSKKEWNEWESEKSTSQMSEKKESNEHMCERRI